MNIYLVVKTLHIISATIVFGTGIGIANFMFFGHRSRLAQERAFAARMTVQADFLWNDYWLMLTYSLSLLAAACWVPVVIIQMRMKAMLEARLRGEAFN